MAALRVELKPKAMSHIAAASTFYGREADENVVARFLLDLDVALKRVAAYPNSCPLYHRNTRRLLLNNFPYWGFYRVQIDRVEVFAILHAQRNPDFLLRQAK